MRRTLFYAAFLSSLLPGALQAQRFASTLAVGDNEVIVGEAVNSYRPGIVYIYRKSGNEWREAARLTAPRAQPRDGFGASLALDGESLYVGTANGGPVQIFRKSGGTWNHVEAIQPPADAVRERFGAALAAENGWLLVGAPARVVQGGGRGGPPGGGGAGPAPVLPSGKVYAYRVADLSQVVPISASDVSPGDAFGAAVAISGNQAVIGAPGRNNAAGGAYVFRLENGPWRESGKLSPRTANPDQQFGASVAITGDNALIGMPRDGGGYGAAIVFARDAQSGNWVEQQRIAGPAASIDAFGSALAVAGTEAWIGTPGAGRVGGVLCTRSAARRHHEHSSSSKGCCHQ